MTRPAVHFNYIGKTLSAIGAFCKKYSLLLVYAIDLITTNSVLHSRSKHPQTPRQIDIISRGAILGYICATSPTRVVIIFSFLKLIPPSVLALNSILSSKLLIAFLSPACEASPIPLLMTIVLVVLVSPTWLVFLYLFSQTTYTLFPYADISWLYDSPTPSLSLIVLPKLDPSSLLILNNISLLGDVSSVQAKYTLLPDTAICGCCEKPAL